MDVLDDGPGVAMTLIVISGAAGVGKTALACAGPIRLRTGSPTGSSTSTCAASTRSTQH
jgi:anion-transporting  ArsA/GET3 family ATPase